MTSSSRLISLILVLVLCFGCLFSCDKESDTKDDNDVSQNDQTGDENNKVEDEILQTDTYKISVRVAFLTTKLSGILTVKFKAFLTAPASE